jgi:hypothetical protein
MALFGLFGSTSKIASQYSDREPASVTARRKALAKAEAGRPDRVARHRSRGIRKAADRGNAWEDANRGRYSR